MEKKFIQSLHQYRKKLAFQKAAEGLFFFLLLFGSPLVGLFSLQKYLPAFPFQILSGLLFVGAGFFLAHLLYRFFSLSLDETARILDHHLPSKDLIQTALFVHRHQSNHPFGPSLFKGAALFLEPSPSLPPFGFPPGILIPLAILSLGLALVSPPEKGTPKKISRVLLIPLEESLPQGSPPKTQEKSTSVAPPTKSPSGSLKKLLKRLKEQREEHRWMKKILRDPRFKALRKALALPPQDPSSEKKLEKILRDPSVQKALQRDLPPHLKGSLFKKNLSAGELAKTLQKLARAKGLSPSQRASLDKKIRESLSGNSSPFKASPGSSGGAKNLYEQEKILPEGDLSLSDLSPQLNHFSISPIYWLKIQKYFQLMRNR